ncbi:MAG: winged helix-turn-helix transcriptional regulator [Clostridia bacterium]|nr:winged helix-turn-helix transcriptional regulator [Clostridia bacterium]
MYDRYKNFTVMILKIQRAIQKIKSEEMGEFNLKIPHVSCIYYLYKEESLTATELCDICQEDKSYISHALKYLEENGYIFCESTAKKRYNAPFSLTEKGKELGVCVANKIDAVLEPAGIGMTEEERTVLYRCLARICENLDQICEKYDE